MTEIGLKIIGTALTVGSGIGCGMICAKRERTRLTVLDAWIGVIERIRLEIDLYLRPLKEIVDRIPSSLLLAAGANAPRFTLQGVLLAASPYLPDDARQMIGALLSDLGASYRHEQLKRCDTALFLLRREREKLSGELPARMRICRSVSCCIAAGIAILLW